MGLRSLPANVAILSLMLLLAAAGAVATGQVLTAVVALALVAGMLVAVRRAGRG